MTPSPGPYGARCRVSDVRSTRRRKMLPERQEIVLLVNLETLSVLGHCYLDNLRCHALRFYGPIVLEQFTRVTLRIALPRGAQITTCAQAMRAYDGAQYALRLLPGAGTDTLLGAGREAAWEIVDAEGLESTSDFFERRIDLPDPEAEDTILELDFPEHDLSPLSEVMSDGSGRFIEWLEREDQRHGNVHSPTLEIANDPAETAMILPPTARTPAPGEVNRAAVMLQLPLQKKKQLAVSGGAEIRAALISDPETSLQSWVFRNPDLTEEEVVEYIKRVDLTPQSIALIYASPRWSLSLRVVRQLIRSPSVPECDLPRLMATVPTQELRTLLAIPDLPLATSDAARKALLERSA